MKSSTIVDSLCAVDTFKTQIMLIVKNIPGAVCVFQRRQIFQPIAAVQIGGTAFIAAHHAHLRFVYVSADDVIIPLFNADFTGHTFKILDIAFHDSFHLISHIFGNQNILFAILSAHGVNQPVGFKDGIIGSASEFGEPARAATNGEVVFVAVKNPVLFTINMQHYFVAQLQRIKLITGKMAHVIIVIAGKIVDRHSLTGVIEYQKNIFNMLLREISGSEIPDVQPVAVDN